MGGLSDVLHGGEVTTGEVARVRDVVVFEPPDLKAKLIRFWILLILASAIATYGLLGDSVATIIGAMIVAPLMLPIMGLAYGIAVGDGRAIGMSLLVGVGGILTAVAVGFVLAQVMTASFDPEQVGQIMARTSPNLIDMLAALATGLAGAFAIGRKDVSDTLPGVAIAISLVPPLANVGILLSVGRTGSRDGESSPVRHQLPGHRAHGVARIRSHGLPAGRVRREVSPEQACGVGAGGYHVRGHLGALGRAELHGVGRTHGDRHGDRRYRDVARRLGLLPGLGQDRQRELDARHRYLRVGDDPPRAELERALSGKVFGLDVLLQAVPSEQFQLTTR